MKLDLVRVSKKVHGPTALVLLWAVCGTFIACDNAARQTAKSSAVQQPGGQQPAGQEEDATKWDQYVALPKIFPFDLKSAGKELTGKTVWVRAGNSLPYFTYNANTQTADLKHRAGVLPPLEKLKVKGVFLQKAPVVISPGQLTVLQNAIFAAAERPNNAGLVAVQVGTSSGQDFKFTANDAFYFADPHVLYKHWPSGVWSAVDSHQPLAGMNELQAEMALGTNAKYTSGDYGNRTIEYVTSGGSVKVTFQKNKAVKISDARSASPAGG